MKGKRIVLLYKFTGHLEIYRVRVKGQGHVLILITNEELILLSEQWQVGKENFLYSFIDFTGPHEVHAGRITVKDQGLGYVSSIDKKSFWYFLKIKSLWSIKKL